VSIVDQQANAMDAVNAIMFVETAEYSVHKWKRPFRVWKYRKTSQRTFLNALALLMVISHISGVIRNVDITSQEWMQPIKLGESISVILSLVPSLITTSLL